MPDTVVHVPYILAKLIQLDLSTKATIAEVLILQSAIIENVP